jgi:hypothetical protein
VFEGIKDVVGHAGAVEGAFKKSMNSAERASHKLACIYLSPRR